MKKILAAAISATMLLSGVCANAQATDSGTAPKIFVDDREIHFADQKPVTDTEANRILIPIRGVLEAMGASVNWDGEKRQVRIDSKDNLTRLILTIDDDIMEVWTAVSLTKYDTAEYTLDCAPVIMNNRTMIPLRAISENMSAEVDWDDSTKTATIHTKEYNKYIAKMTEENSDGDESYVYSLKDNLPNAYISADTDAVAAGDTVQININVSNSEVLGDTTFGGITAAVYYDSSKFEYVKAELIVDGEVYTNSLGATNEYFQNDSVKSAIIIMPSANEEDQIKFVDGTYLRYTFTSINGEESEFVLSDRKTDRGYDTGFLLNDGKSNNMYENYKELYIDTTPLVIKAK